MIDEPIIYERRELHAEASLEQGRWVPLVIGKRDGIGEHLFAGRPCETRDAAIRAGERWISRHCPSR